MRTRINVALAFDNKYVKYAHVTLLSLFENNAEADVYVYILQSDLTEESKDSLLSLATQYGMHIVFLDVDESRFCKLPTLGRWSIQIYYRLLLPELLPQEVDRIVYLDSDMVVNASLSPLFELNLDGYDLGACYDLNVSGASMDDLLSQRHPCFEELFTSNTYINSGMLLLNIPRLRNNYTLDIYFQAAEELDYKIFAPDQDLINYVHRGKILLLDNYTYNYPAYFAFLDNMTVEYLKANTAIVHFVGEKPWSGGDHGHFPTEILWWHYALSSEYAEEFMKEYIFSSMSDLTVFNGLLGNDKIKNALYMENLQLQKELENAMKQIQQAISLFSK